MKLLDGVRVLDVSWLIPGPHTTMMLADLGADVIKIETPKPSNGDYFRIALDADNPGGMNPFFVWMNRNKRSITIDFKKKEGQVLIHELVKTAHIFVEGSRPGAIAKYGMSYDELSAINPKLVYCSVTGFGQDNPYANLASHGGGFDALGAVAKPLQLEDGSWVQHRPYPHPGVTNGPWLANVAILAGLHQATATGTGCYIDLACSDAVLMSYTQEILQGMNGLGQFNVEEDPEEAPSAKYTYYETKDGKFFLLLATEKHLWQQFCRVIGREDLQNRGDWDQTPIGRDISPEDARALRAELVPIFKSKTQDEWTRIFTTNHLAGAPYTDPHDITTSPYFKARGMIAEHVHPRAGRYLMPANAIKVKGEPFEIRLPAPEQGEHTDQVLKELGLGEQRIAQLRTNGVI
jgi:crotonobetainyl-CoA:carnitine CoA-transferase CaiB-like acyl-CoA transferase